MSKDFNLLAELRPGQGKGASRRLRREGKVPAVLYGGGRPPRTLMFNLNKVLRELESESFYSSILNIRVGDKSQAVIVKDIQRHPSKPIIMHMDFQRIIADEKIKMNVPIHYLHGDESIGVKSEGGSVSQLISDVEVSCLPGDLPEYFEVDISGMHVNDMLHLSDIKLPPGVEITELTHGPDRDYPIVSIHIIREVAIETDADAEDAEPADDAAAPAAGDEDAT